MEISARVGVDPDAQQCENTVADQVVVMNLLDAVDTAAGGAGTAWTPPSEGWCSDDLAAAIVRFQQEQGLTTDPVGVVTPGGETLLRLSEVAEAPAPEQPPAPAGRLRLWVSAFIPGAWDPLTSPVPDSSGRTMVHGPVPGVSDCFLTDQRDFSADPAASSRVHSEIVLDLSTGLTDSESHRCDDTVEVDCEDGDEEGRANGDTSRCSFAGPAPDPAGRYQLDLRMAANNPLFTGSPDIDVTGTFVVDAAARTVSFSGKIDEFPAYEGYVALDDQPPVTLFQRLPDAGRSPADIFGEANRPVEVTVTY
jgi:hypothetical protein